MTEYRIHVEGLVQQVGFRAFVQSQAFSLGIKGYVRNLADGGVLAVAQGESHLLDVFVECLTKGPRSAEVTNIDVKKKTATELFGSFEVRY